MLNYTNLIYLIYICLHMYMFLFRFFLYFNLEFPKEPIIEQHIKSKLFLELFLASCNFKFRTDIEQHMHIQLMVDRKRTSLQILQI